MSVTALIGGLASAVVSGALIVLFQVWVQGRADPLKKEGQKQKVPVLRSNLPNRTFTEFVGRESELKTALRILGPDHRLGVVTIDGVGGIGKSTLALEIAFRCRDLRMFDGIVWVSAKRTTLTPDGIVTRQQSFSTFDDLCLVLAQVLGLPELAKGDAEVRQAILHATLATQRVLLILDNLETVDDLQVANLLRELPAPSKAVVTTRHRIDVAYDIHLGQLSVGESLNLMRRECETKSVQLSEQELRLLHRATSGIPLAIVWSISQMAVKGRTLQAILDGLAKEDNDICRFCFRESVALLDGDERKALCTLALFDEQVDRAVIGRIAGFAQDTRRRDEAIGRLVQLSLVDQVGDRFGMLPLARRFARSELEQEPTLEQELRERWVGSFIGREGALVPVTIYFPVNVPGDLETTIRAFVDRFNSLGTNAYVLPIFPGSYSQTNEALEHATSSGTFPDATILEVAQWLDMAQRGMLLPLDATLVPKGREQLLSQGFEPHLFSNISYKGRVYGIPCNRSVPVIYYNRDRMNGSGLTHPDSPPQTWADLIGYATRLVDTYRGAHTDEFFPIGLPTDEDWFLACFARQAGGRVIDDEGTAPVFDGAQTVEALEFWAQLCKSRLARPNDTWFQAPQDFLGGRSAMLFHSSASYQFLKASADFGVGVWPLPYKQQPAIEIGGANFVILANRPEEQQQAAWRFIEWFTATEQTADWAMKTGYLPVRDKSFQLPSYLAYVRQHPGMEVIVEQRQLAFPRSSAPYFSKPRSLLLATIRDVLNGDKSTGEALASIQQFALSRASE